MEKVKVKEENKYIPKCQHKYYIKWLETSRGIKEQIMMQMLDEELTNWINSPRLGLVMLLNAAMKARVQATSSRIHADKHNKPSSRPTRSVVCLENAEGSLALLLEELQTLSCEVTTLIDVINVFIQFSMSLSSEMFFSCQRNISCYLSGEEFVMQKH